MSKECSVTYSNLIDLAKTPFTQHFHEFKVIGGQFSILSDLKHDWRNYLIIWSKLTVTGLKQSCTRNSPLTFSFHCRGSNRNQLSWTRLCTREGLILIYPKNPSSFWAAALDRSKMVTTNSPSGRVTSLNGSSMMGWKWSIGLTTGPHGSNLRSFLQSHWPALVDWTRWRVTRWVDPGTLRTAGGQVKSYGAAVLVSRNPVHCHSLDS